jgi:hypothetical protein
MSVTLEGRALHIFPCRAKKPACLHGFKDATADPNAITDLFRRYPSARQIGVATGEINQIDCLDVDPRNGGNKFWEENRDRLPRTRIHETPSGGHHVLFRHAPGLRCSSGRIADGIDVKSTGGFIIWWPAQFYPVQEAPVAEWPEWLLRLAREKQHKHTAVNYERDGTLMIRSPSLADHEVPKPLYFKVLDLMPDASGHNRRRVLGLLNVLVRKCENRNDALNSIGFSFRELISAGVIDRSAAESLLIDAATLNGYIAKDGLCAAIATIRSSLGPVDHQGPISSICEEEKAQ